MSAINYFRLHVIRALMLGLGILLLSVCVSTESLAGGGRGYRKRTAMVKKRAVKPRRRYSPWERSELNVNPQVSYGVFEKYRTNSARDRNRRYQQSSRQRRLRQIRARRARARQIEETKKLSKLYKFMSDTVRYDEKKDRSRLDQIDDWNHDFDLDPMQ